MQSQNQPIAAQSDVKRIRIDELTSIGATLTEEELNAVSGAMTSLRPSWTSGPSHRTDEWVR